MDLVDGAAAILDHVRDEPAVNRVNLGQRFVFRVWGPGCRVEGLGFGVQGLGFRVQGLGLRVQG